MKILLVRPKIKNLFTAVNFINVEPLELEYLAAVAGEEGWEYLIVDEMVEKRRFQKVLSLFKPDVVGITGYCNSTSKMLKYARSVKRFNMNTKVVIGGIHAEINYTDFYIPQVDVIVHSGGSETFRRLLRVIEGEYEYKDLLGCCIHINNNEWCCNAPAPFDPDKLPRPDRSHFYQHKRKFRYLHYGTCALVKTAYGCPYTCSFCYCKLLNGQKYSLRSVEDVMDEIQQIDCSTIWIVDDTFLVDRDRIKRFAADASKRGINKKFIIYGRADFICENEDLIPILRNMGVVDIIVGLEAVEDTRLKEYHKEYDALINECCVDILNSNGILCTGLFIVHGNDTKDDFNRLYRWIKKKNLSLCTVSIFTPLPGTALHKEYKEKINISKHEHLDFLHLVMEPGKMGKFTFYYEFYKIYLKLLWRNLDKLWKMLMK